jgi:spermidine synthase
VDVVAALRARNRVVGVEINPIIVRDVMQGRFREKTGSLYLRPDVRIAVDEGRSYVRRSRARYDVIQATMVDTWAATASGAFALTENYLYTVEAFQDYLEHLSRDGILSVTRWCIPPDMECIRVVPLAREALRRLGIPNANRHVFVAWKATMGTVLVRRSPFPQTEVDALQREVQARGMQTLYYPEQPRQDTMAMLVRAPDPTPVYDAFPSDISPVTDDRPFFFYGVKPGEFLSAALDFDWLMLNSFAVAVLVALFAIVLALVLAFIVVPLFVHRREALRVRPLSKLRDLSFFVCLGVGFIVVEVILLQRFGLFLGHPSYSLVVVLFSLLLAGGVGSALSDRIPEPRRRLGLGIVAGVVAALLVAYAYGLPWVFHRWIGAPLDTRIAVAVVLVMLPGLAMGMMLPTGVRLVSSRHPEIIPWGWGLNGAASVFGSVGAMIVAMNLGARAALLVGAACYLLALAAGCRAPGKTTVPAAD